MSTPGPDPAGTSAPVWRRLAAILYDTLIVIALLMVAMALLLPLNHGEAFSAGNLWVQLYLLGIGVTFFILFWKKAGQTVGMRAWQIRLVHEDSRQEPAIIALLARALLAIVSWALLGLGFFWCFVDPQKSGWHDRLSKTRLILAPHK